ALDPVHCPAWLPPVEAGLLRLGLASWSRGDSPTRIYSSILQSYRAIQLLHPACIAAHVDHFLCLVASLPGRELEPAKQSLTLCEPWSRLPASLREVRPRAPLRNRLKEHGRRLHEARQKLAAAVAGQEGSAIGHALALVDPRGVRRCSLDWQTLSERLAFWT